MSTIEHGMSGGEPNEGAARLTLHSVRSFLSPAVYDNPAWKGLLYFARDLVVFAAIGTGLLLTDAWYFVVPLWILAGLSISSLFIIGHDAAHGALFKSPRLSYWVGQIAMLPSLHAYEQWCYGHNRVHHGHTIKMDGDFVWRPTSPKEYARMSLFGKAMHRLYWSRFGSGIYYMIEIWGKGMVAYTAPIKGALRDKLLMLVFALGSSAAMFYAGAALHPETAVASGVWMFIKLGVVPFFLWNYTIGFAVYVHHIHDSISWKRHKDWTPFYGQMQGTVNYHILSPARFFGQFQAACPAASN